MPARGDQHRDTPASANPFRDDIPRIAEYTAKEIATLQSRLDRQLGPEFISTRPGNGGGKVHYLAAEKVINLANEVFGFNGWSSSIQNVQIDFVDENPQNGRINLGLSTIVRVTLKDGTFHEDIGYGHCENTKGKAAAFEKAKKEAATDAMKRALRNFGNVLGNCLYDKDYLQKIARVKVAPSKWDAENLHHHPDYAPIKREPAAEEVARQSKATAVQRNASMQSAHSAVSFGSAEFEDDFGGNLFDETDFSHPDEVRVDDSLQDRAASPGPHLPDRAQNHGQRQAVSRTHSMPQIRNPNVQPPQAVPGVPAPQKPQSVPKPPLSAMQAPQTTMLPPQTSGYSPRPPQSISNGPQQTSGTSRSNSSAGSAGEASNSLAPRNVTTPDPRPEGADEHEFPIPRQPPQGVPEGFVTGKRADLINNPSDARLTSGNIAFNPHADSPSIRRTQGVNPGKSAPVRRTDISGGAGRPASPAPQPPAAASAFQGAGTNGVSGAPRPTGTNFVNPSADMNRKIGMPGATASFQNNRSGYRPPSAVKRPAMADVTNTHGVDGASDAKKPKVDGAAPVQAENAVPVEQN